MSPAPARRIVFLAALLGCLVFAGTGRAADDVAAFVQSMQPALSLPDAAKATDWQASGEKLAALVANQPGYTNDQLEFTAACLLRKAGKYAPASVGPVAAVFAQSPNTVLNKVGLAYAALEKAKTEPVAMSFDALDGRKVDLAQMRGRVVLIQYWATWCSSCKVQLPLLREIYTKYQPLGFEIVGITMERDEAHRKRLEEDIEKYSITWPQYFDGLGLGHNVWTQKFAVVAAPTYLLLDRQGLLVARTDASGGLNNLEAVVRTQLGLPPLHPEDPGLVLGEARPKTPAK